MKYDNSLRDNIERWLLHQNYSFTEMKNPQDNFHISIGKVGPYRIPLEIFEPKRQPGVIVVGGKVILRNRQTARYLKLNPTEQEKFKSSVKNYCDSIRAVHKVFREDGRLVIGVYVVLDDVERFTQQIVTDSIQQVIEMSEKTNQFVMKTF